MIEIIGIFALLVIFASMAASGVGLVVVTHGFGSRHKADYVISWSILIGGIIGFILTWYFNIEIGIK